MLLFEDCRYVVITNTLGRINRFKSYWWNGDGLTKNDLKNLTQRTLRLNLNNKIYIN